MSSPRTTAATVPPRAGAALPILLLPGFLCDVRAYSGLIGALSRQVSVHVANLTHSDCVEALAGQVLRQAPLRFVALGHSLGGMVAMAMLRQAPERMAHLALLDADPLPEQTPIRDWRVELMDRVDRGGLGEVVAEMLPGLVGNGPARTDALTLWRTMAVDLGPGVFLRQARALCDRRDQQDTLERARPGALVLAGADDRMCPRDQQERLVTLLPKARLEFIAASGHLPTLEAADATAGAVNAWLRDTI